MNNDAKIAFYVLFTILIPVIVLFIMIFLMNYYSTKCNNGYLVSKNQVITDKLGNVLRCKDEK